MSDHHLHLHPHRPRAGAPPPGVYPPGHIDRYVAQAFTPSVTEIASDAPRPEDAARGHREVVAAARVAGYTHHLRVEAKRRISEPLPGHGGRS